MFKPFSLFVLTAALLSVSPVQAQSANGQAGALKKNGVVFSVKYKNLTADKAYALQKAFVKNSVAKGAEITGFKAGLTSSKSAAKVGLEEPITGVLMMVPKYAAEKPVFRLQDSHRLMLEQELAFRISQPIRDRVTEEEVKAYVAAVAPAVELPDVTFPNEQFNGLDIIANNALAYQFIVGEWSKPGVDLDAVEVSLRCNDEIITQGKGNNALGGQWKALSWMINHLLDQGYAIQKNQILITGNLGKLLPAKPCNYQADYGALGSFGFIVES